MAAAAAIALATTTILYIRHGEVPGNNPSPETYIYTGCNTDEDLTEKGKTQAQECANKILQMQKEGKLGPISAIYSSPAKRAQETAAPISDVLGLEVKVEAELREIYWGAAEGMRVDEMAAKYGDEEKRMKELYADRKERWDHLPVFEDAETYNQVLKRSTDALNDIAKVHRGETVVVVGHGRDLKTLIADSKDSEDKIPYPVNCGIAEFTIGIDGKVHFVQVKE